MSLLTALLAFTGVIARPEPKRVDFGYEAVTRALARVSEITIEREQAKRERDLARAERDQSDAQLRALAHQRDRLLLLLVERDRIIANLEGRVIALRGGPEERVVAGQQQQNNEQLAQQAYFGPSPLAQAQANAVMHRAFANVREWAACTCVPGRSALLRPQPIDNAQAVAGRPDGA